MGSRLPDFPMSSLKREKKSCSQFFTFLWMSCCWRTSEHCYLRSKTASSQRMWLKYWAAACVTIGPLVLAQFDTPSKACNYQIHSILSPYSLSDHLTVKKQLVNKWEWIAWNFDELIQLLNFKSFCAFWKDNFFGKILAYWNVANKPTYIKLL